MDYQGLLERIHSELEPRFGEGRVATYITELAQASSERFGMSLMTPSGERFSVGDAEVKFSIQSVSKIFALALAMKLVGDDLWTRCGREPSGNPFNSLVQLEYESGIPRNPFINAGALVTTDIIFSELEDAQETVLELVRALSNCQDIHFNERVAASEAATGHRNIAMAHLIKSFGNLKNSAADVLDAYFHHCSIEMTCAELAAACLFLSNEARAYATGQPMLTKSQTKYLNAIMLTCGTYDAVGDFAYRVGLPAKSGVGGAIVACLPRAFSVCVWSPGLDENGNSLLGLRALELLTTYSGQSIF